MLQTLQRSRTPSGAAYLDQGEGDETVVLIHGVGMRIEAWGPQIERLAETCRVIAVDLPGHGGSTPLDGPPRLEQFVAWFGRVLEELSLGPVNVAGHSMGALIVTGIAATAQDKVRRVALLNGVHRRSEAARKAVMARADEIVSGAFDREAPLSRWFSVEERNSEAYVLVRDLLQAVDAAGYADAYRAFASGDSIYSDCWPRVTRPALFLTGSDDMNSTAEMAQGMARAAPHGKVVVIPGHRHMVNLTTPETVNAALADWLTWEVENDT
ncbi:alpha/beta hydrolase (plasmid) [Rhizobium sp. TH2]|uniref:alpha/beta fold hydrolase n=1 Tax=Rhizobium sp. TH2 TaxID=2775403 RepID=UPI0021584213|nr:alpha/beta hydrolase [Rhizobium sp. TH2]UVC12166.1 alpha/beta hydrolase [Rhizobium sp. TH2]